MTNQNNQTNKTPVLFVQPVADDVTPNEIEAECNAVAELRAVICQPTAAMAEVRKEFGGYFAGAGMICEAVAALLQENNDEELQEIFADDGEILAEAASLFYGAACYLVSPKYVAQSKKPFPFIVKAIQSPNEFNQNDCVAITAALDKALQMIRVLQDDAGLQDLFMDDFTEDDYAESKAFISLIKAALPLPREVMAERGEYYADENDGEA